MTIYLLIKVICPMDGENVGVEDCYDCCHFEGLNDEQDLLMCGF